jgi:parallel beta-helix repeat protein
MKSFYPIQNEMILWRLFFSRGKGMEINYVVPMPGMVIKEDTTFLPGVYTFFEGEGIIIGADNITLYGNGAVLIGGKKKVKNSDQPTNDEFSYGYSARRKDDSLGYHGIAVYAKNIGNVTIKDLTAKNFEIGLKLEHCHHVTIMNNDFSYNYHNPDHGWDEHEDLGGIVLEHSHQCIIKDNKAMNVWNALTIRYGNQNVVQENQFSHTSNVGLRLWRSCENEFYQNDFSWGIRKEPFEVHARDSSCVLIETGSNHNRFIGNDMRFGGDGLFIRSLNGWMSTGNYFEENDTSFANNNAIEAWDEGNTYVRNKANFSSYGFWLGNSDNTVLIENEVCYNGVNFKNAPENFGNAGISVVNGSGTNFRLVGNKIHHNNGPGVAIRNRVEYPSLHWVIEENEIYGNKSDQRGFIGHGIYLKYAKNITLINNEIYDNDGESVYLDEYAADVKEFQRLGEARELKVRIHSSSKCFVVGEEYTFWAEVNQDHHGLNFNWDFGDAEARCEEKISRVFDKPGFHRVMVSVNDGENVGYDCIHAYVLAPGLELADDGCVSHWSVKSEGEIELHFQDQEFVSGTGSIMVQSNGVKDATLKYPVSEDLGIDASRYTHFSFCLKYLNEMIDWYKENKTPIIRFCTDKENYIEFTPKPNLIGEIASQYNESKYGWVYLELDLYSDGSFSRKVIGDFDSRKINCIEIDIDNQLSPHSIFMINGMRFITKVESHSINFVDITNHLHDHSVRNLVEVSSEGLDSDALAPLTRNPYFGDYTKRWISSKDEGQEYYQINFDTERTFNSVVVDFYQSNENTFYSNHERLPQKLVLEYFSDGEWREVLDGKTEVDVSHHVMRFSAVIGRKVRLILIGEEKPFSIFNVEVSHRVNKLHLEDIESVETSTERLMNLEKIGVKLNHSLHDWEKGLSDLVISVHEYEGDILDSQELASKKLDWKDIHFKNETVVELPVEGLSYHKNYYLAMTQKELAEDLTHGDYYRWAGSGISMMDGQYGYINHDGVVNENKVGWGQNWLKVYTDRCILDLSHHNPTLGNRFGLTNMEKIYQTFKLINPINLILQGSISPQNQWAILDEEWIEISLKKMYDVHKVVLYFIEDSSRAVHVTIDGQFFEGMNNRNITEVELNKSIEMLRINIKGKSVLKAIEIW